MKTNNKLDITINIINNDFISNHISLINYLIDNNKITTIKDFIFDNIENKDGSPSINNLIINNLKFDSNTNTGKFRLNFNVDRIYCCSEVEASKVDYIDFTFEIKSSTFYASTEYFNWELNN